MKVRREVTFSVQEVKAMTEAAVRKAALDIIGEPKENEKVIVELNEYRDSEVTIIEKDDDL